MTEQKTGKVGLIFVGNATFSSNAAYNLYRTNASARAMYEKSWTMLETRSEFERCYETSLDSIGKLTRIKFISGTVDEREFVERSVNPETMLFISNHVLFNILKENWQGFNYSVSGGHGAGFINAIVEAGAVTYEVALQLVRKGSEHLRKFTNDINGGYLHTFKLSPADTNMIRDLGGIHPAITNTPWNVSYGGLLPHLEKARQELIKRGNKKIGELEPAIPFHTPLVQKISEYLEELVLPIIFKKPQTEILGSSSNTVMRDPDLIKKEVCRLPYSPIDFFGLLVKMLEFEIDSYVVAGADNEGLLSKMVTHNLKNIKGESYNPQVVSVRNHASLEKLLLT